MKKIIFLLITTGWMLSCSSPETGKASNISSTSLSVLFDVTDPRTYWPKVDDLLKLYQYDNRPEAEGLFRLRAITDRRLTPLISFHLADAASMEKNNKYQDPQFRNKNINAFYQTVRKAINDFYTNTDTSQVLSNSECFRIISDELSVLANSRSDQRILAVVSDLMEKSDLLDCYAANLSNPKQVAEQLDRTNLLPADLSGITIIFLFEPKDRKEDQMYSRIVEVYKALMQPKGVIIKVQANL